MKPDHQAQKGTNKTGKKTKRTALNRDGSHLIELFAHAPIGIVECSLDGKYINLNEEFCRITGHTKEELYERAKELGIEGRSRMDKKELARAIAQKQ